MWVHWVFRQRSTRSKLKTKYIRCSRYLLSSCCPTSSTFREYTELHSTPTASYVFYSQCQLRCRSQQEVPSPCQSDWKICQPLTFNMNRRILLLCCRSCLRGDGDNHEYYDVLGLPDKHVTLDAIKKAFKKASLNLHPDKLAQRGIEETAESKLMFLKVKKNRRLLI